MYTALYMRKRSFYKNVNFGSVALGFHYGSCFNASLSRYTLQIYFVFILRKQQVQTSVNCPMQSVVPSYSCLSQELCQGEDSSAAKKDRLEYVKSHWKWSEIYRFSRSATQNQPKNLLVVQPCSPTFLKTLSHLPKNSQLRP